MATRQRTATTVVVEDLPKLSPTSPAFPTRPSASQHGWSTASSRVSSAPASGFSAMSAATVLSLSTERSTM
ncbi:hypothetical protein LB505_005680 [Fusarium chuoi]|nr:hypothetical protein LB505_005680 [Fusarium chuoi]